MPDIHDILARDISRALKVDESDVISLVHHMRRTGIELRLHPEPAPAARTARDRDEELSPAA